MPFFIAVAFVCFELSPVSRGELPPPPPDGGYPNQNTAEGNGALFSLTTGGQNTAVGFDALNGNSTGNRNTANGANALSGNTTGSFNTAVGLNALNANSTGLQNTAIGALALVANTAGTGNIALGYEAGESLTGSDNIDIGNRGRPIESNTIRIGNETVQTDCYIAGINGQIANNGTAVYVEANGKLGTIASSARFKEKIMPMDKASEAILALKPVTFRYKNEFDPKGIPQFGLVAEDVEKVNPDLIARDDHGKPYSVRYEAVNAMLLNEFLKEHKAFVEERCKVDEQVETIARLQKQIEALTAGLQKVSAKLELSKSAPQMTATNQ